VALIPSTFVVGSLCGPGSERLYGELGALATITFRAYWRGGVGWDSGPPLVDDRIMYKEPTPQQWLLKATAFLQRVADAESRFSDSMKVNEVAMLAAADGLQVATSEATLWLVANVCPDVELGRRIALMLNTCAEVALTAQRALTDPSADIEATIGRLRNLFAVIYFQTDDARQLVPAALR
jgi:hypothetical protein